MSCNKSSVCCGQYATQIINSEMFVWRRTDLLCHGWRRPCFLWCSGEMCRRVKYLQAWLCLFACLFVLARQPPVGQGLFTHEVSRSHTRRHTTVGTTPLDEWSARLTDLYITTQNTHNIRAPGGTRTRNPRRRTAADRRLKPARSLQSAFSFTVA